MATSSSHSATPGNGSVLPVTATLPSTETLLKELQVSLDVNKVLVTFAQFIAEHLPVESLSFYHNNTLLTALGVPEFESNCLLKSRLYADNEYLGELRYVFSTKSLNDSSMRWLKECEQQLLFPLRNAITHRNVCNQAVRDHLTNLGNRVLLEEVLAQLLSVHERSDDQHAVMLLDLDNFKQVNDKFGHQRGDAVLTEFAEVLRQQLRGCDQLFRYGGDEFLVIIANPGSSTLQRVYRRLQMAVADSQLLSSHNVTCSAGAVLIKPAHTADTLLEDADSALYNAKHKGGNQLEARLPMALSQIG